MRSWLPTCKLFINNDRGSFPLFLPFPFNYRQNLTIHRVPKSICRVISTICFVMDRLNMSFLNASVEGNTEWSALCSVCCKAIWHLRKSFRNIFFIIRVNTWSAYGYTAGCLRFPASRPPKREFWKGQGVIYLGHFVEAGQRQTVELDARSQNEYHYVTAYWCLQMGITQLRQQ